MSPRKKWMTVPGDVIDAHLHLFTVGIFEEYLAAHPEAAERYKKALAERKFGPRGGELPDLDPEAMADEYSRTLQDAGVSHGVVVSVFPDSEYVRGFTAAAEGRIAVLCNVDPTDPASPELLEREIGSGMRGVKLLPVNRCYRLSDPACRPFFEKAAELETAMIVHYGVTVDPSGDLRYADPIDLSPVARDFPEITFVIAHFGAGYLDQVLKLGYQCKNVCVDSSGTNNWMDKMVQPMTLADVFERSIVALGSERVLFGTDSGTMKPYRKWIKYQQVRTLEEIGLSEGDRDLVLRGNAVRIFGLEG
jgi:predicted TIM-barrel fold metal-dependent hydrolase